MTNRFPAAPPRPVVRVVHPCGDLRGRDPQHFDAGVDALRALGCTVRLSPDGRERTWPGRKLAGSDSARLHELVAALTDPHADIVWIARGGHGAARIVRDALVAVGSAPPKIIIGFSDATTLLNAFAAHGWPTVHGPVLTSFSKAQPQADAWRTLDVLCGRVDTIHFTPGPGPRLEGVLFGGNLTVLSSIAGLGVLPARDDAIWLIEDLGEHAYALDRAFTHLRLGPLREARGVWLGPLDTTRPDEGPLAVEIIEGDAPCPVIHHAPIGHTGPNVAIPLGIPVVLDPARGTLRWHVEHAHA